MWGPKGTAYASDQDFWVALAEGRIAGATPATLAAGVVDNPATGTVVDMWDDPAKGDITTLTTNTTMEIVSSSASDTSAYLVFGLKDDGAGNWVEVPIQTVFLTGTTAITLTSQYERITFCLFIPATGNSNVGTIQIRPVSAPGDVQLYMSPRSIVSRKGIISVPTNTTYFPEYFSFSIARSTGGGGATKTGEMSLVTLVDDTNYQNLFSFGMSTTGTSAISFDTPGFFTTGIPTHQKRELKFRCLADSNNTKFFSTVFSWQKIKG